MRNLSTFIFTLFLISGCTGIPENVAPITGFNQQKYLGTWYEIARLDNRFERGLTGVTATYSVRDDGGIEVLNQGVDNNNQRQQVIGKAYFVNNENTAHLKVSFFGPFYASYVVFKLDDNYQTAYVSGNNHDYLWLLARTPTVTDAVKQDFISQAKKRGFDLANLVWVKQ